LGALGEPGASGLWEGRAGGDRASAAGALLVARSLPDRGAGAGAGAGAAAGAGADADAALERGIRVAWFADWLFYSV